MANRSDFWPSVIELQLEAGGVKDCVLKALVESAAERRPVQALDLWTRVCRFRQQAAHKIVTPSTVERHCRCDNVRNQDGSAKFLGQTLRDHGIELRCGEGEVTMPDYIGPVKLSYIAAVRT